MGSKMYITHFLFNAIEIWRREEGENDREMNNISKAKTKLTIKCEYS